MATVSSIEVVWTVAISLLAQGFSHNLKRPLDSGAYRKDRSAAVGPSDPDRAGQ
jgi:hypothetical protein